MLAVRLPISYTMYQFIIIIITFSKSSLTVTKLPTQNSRRNKNVFSKPLICWSERVVAHVQIHLRQFDKTNYSAQDTGDCEPSAGQQTAETCIDEPSAGAAAAVCV